MAAGALVPVEPTELSTARRTTRTASPDVDVTVGVVSDGFVIDVDPTDVAFAEVDALDAGLPDVDVLDDVPEAVFFELVFFEVGFSEVGFSEVELPDAGLPDDDFFVLVFSEVGFSEVELPDAGFPDDDFSDDDLSGLASWESEWARELTAPDEESPPSESPFPGAA